MALHLGRPAEREAAAFEALGLPADGFGTDGPPIRARGTRRPLRERAEALQLCDEEHGVVRLDCELRAGSYVTVLVETLFGSVESEASVESGAAVPAAEAPRDPGADADAPF